MKKLMIAAAIVCAAVASQAAQVKWQNTANMYGSNLTDKYTGAATLYCVEKTGWSLAGTFNDGALTAVMSGDDFTGGEVYSFYFKVTDGGKTFTSATKSVAAPTTATPAQLQWGNMLTASQTSGNWVAVPEPTSALLMLLGVAGLALKRRRA